MDPTLLVALLVALLGFAGVLLAALVPTLTPRGRKRVVIASLSIVVLALIALYVAIGHPNGASSGAAGGSGSSTGGTGGPDKSGDVREQSDNHHGVSVYANPQGEAAPGSVPHLIPYATTVNVKCYELNQSSMSSVTAFYKIDGGTWDGLWAVSDPFTNGDALGKQGGSSLDKRVPHCSP